MKVKITVEIENEGTKLPIQYYTIDTIEYASRKLSFDATVAELCYALKVMFLRLRRKKML